MKYRMPTRALLARALAVATLLWAAALPLATASAAAPRSAPLYLFALAIYGAGSVLCHQLPARSFHLWNTQMPVCARCAGLYAGGAVGAAIASAVRAASTTPFAARAMLALAAVPTALTLVYEWTTGDAPGNAPGNAMRALSGLPLGAVIVALLVVQGRREAEVN